MLFGQTAQSQQALLCRAAPLAEDASQEVLGRYALESDYPRLIPPDETEQQQERTTDSQIMVYRYR